MKMHIPLRCLLPVVLPAMMGTAQAVTTFTETFDTNASGWLTGASGAPTYSSTGGVANSGYISFTSTFTSGASGGFPGAPPLQILMRGNNAANASGDAFVGNWLASGATVSYLTLSVRHNYTASLDLYARLNAAAGAAASLSTGNSIAPNVWTEISIPIVNTNPPFLSYGAGTFNSVFTNINDLQFGLFVPASTTFTDLQFDIDNVSITTVPETSSVVLLGAGALGLLRRKRR